ncbi:hypothetical protein [Pyrobaculum islandicum]|nr:hypothetical protein [Pyrobaculum islandicum]
MADCLAGFLNTAAGGQGVVERRWFMLLPEGVLRSVGVVAW